MYENQEQVIRTLLELDYELGKKVMKEKAHFCIFGGTAFLFFSENFRGTSDIDVYFLNKILDDEVIKIINQYDINNQMQGVTGVPEDYLERAYELDGFRNIKVFVAHPIDLVISKLMRGEMRDTADVLESGILDLIEDLDKLRDLYNETKDYVIGHPIRFINIDDIIEEYHRRK